MMNSEPTEYGFDLEVLEARVQALKEIVESGKVPGNIHLILLPEAREELVMRAALFHRFDHESLKIACEKAVPDFEHEWEWLLASPHVKPSGPDKYLVREKTPFLESWRDRFRLIALPLGSAPEIMHLNTLLARHFKERQPGWEQEYLHHLFISDWCAAATFLGKQVKHALPRPGKREGLAIPSSIQEAREGMALGHAIDLLAVYDGQIANVSLPLEGANDLQKVYSHCRRQVNSWTEWQQEWTSSRRYIPRPDVHKEFAKLRESSKERVLEIHASGGSGKTMSLRWLIAHHCIPRGLPVAHVDFDDYLGGKPFQDWQLLCRCLEQLETQIGEGPFRSLIRDMQDGEKRLESSESVSEDGRMDSIRTYARLISQRLVAAKCGIVTIIVDTMEEAMLRRGAVELIGALLDITSRVPDVRLILCGRYPLTSLDFDEQLERSNPDAHAYYEKAVRSIRLPQFDLAETGAYLESRGLTINRTQLATLFRKCKVKAPKGLTAGKRSLWECSPFDLALIAGLVMDVPDSGRKMKLEEILKTPEKIHTIYLMERVILHISSIALRWVIRYGVVPRRLTRDFFVEVILPHLKEVHQGKVEGDDPRQDDLPRHLQLREIFFQKDQLLDKEGGDGLWDELRRFARPGSWLEEKDDALIFQTKVREPMRKVLREKDVLQSIHQRSAGYFADREAEAEAAGDAAMLLGMAQERLYHEGQLNPGKAVQELFVRIEYALVTEQFKEAASLAYSATEGGFIPIDSEEDRLRLLERRCVACLDVSDVCHQPAERKKWLARTRQAVGILRREAGWEPGLEILDAMVCIREERPGEKLLHSLEKLKGELGFDYSDYGDCADYVESQNYRRVARSVALACVATGNRDGITILSRLLRERLRGHEEWMHPLSCFLARSLAEFRHTSGVTPEGVDALRQAADVLLTLDTELTPYAAEFVLALADLLKKSMRYGEAADFLSRFFPEAPGMLSGGRAAERSVGWRAFLMMLGARASSDPEAALWDYQYLEVPKNGVLEGLARMGQSWAHSLQGNITAAENRLLEAQRNFSKVGHPLAAQCQMMLAGLALHHGNSPLEANKALDVSLRVRYDTPAPMGISGRYIDLEQLPAVFLQLELSYKTSDLKRWEDAVGFVEWIKDSKVWYDRLYCAITLLSTVAGSASAETIEAIAVVLAECYEACPDAITRANHPWLLRDVPGRLPVSRATKERLTRLVRISGRPVPMLSGKPAAIDQAWAAVAHGHLLRLLGEDQLAREMAALAERHFVSLGLAAGMREVWYLRAIGGWEAVDPAVMREFLQLPYPLLAAIAVEQALQAHARKHHSLVERWLDVPGLEETLMETRPSWLGYFQGLRAGIAFRNGDGATADELLRLARELYDAHRNPGLRNLIQDSMDSREKLLTKAVLMAAPPSPPPVARHRKLILSRDPFVRRTGGDAISTGLMQLVGLAFSETNLTNEAIVNSLLVDPGAFARELAGLMESRARWSVGKGDLRIDAKPLALAALPWEMTGVGENAAGRSFIYRAVGSDNFRIRRIQRALQAGGDSNLAEDGVWGIKTENAYKRFLKKIGFKRGSSLGTWDLFWRAGLTTRSGSKGELPRVTIVYGGSDYLGIVKRRVLELYQTYVGAGFNCMELEIHQFDQMEAMMEHLYPQDGVIHLVSRYRQSRSTGKIEADFSSESKDGGLPADWLPRRSLPPRPLLILDGIHESHPVENVQQVLLRNAYAASVAGESWCANVLAPVMGQPASELIPALVRMANGGSLREIYGALVKPPTSHLPGLHEAFQPPPALWTSDPDMSVFFSGTNHDHDL